MTTSWVVVAPSTPPVGAPSVRATRSVPSESESSTTVTSIEPLSCPAGITSGPGVTVASAEVADPPTL